MRVLVSLALLMSAPGLACAPAAAPEEPIDLTVEQDALLEADRNWAQTYATSDNPAVAFMESLADDVSLLAPEMPLVKGKDAFGGVFEQLESLPGFQLTWTPSTAEVSSGADLGFTIGSYFMKVDGPDGNPALVEGKYLTVWRKQADGSWKVTADMFNPNAPAVSAE